MESICRITTVGQAWAVRDLDGNDVWHGIHFEKNRYRMEIIRLPRGTVVDSPSLISDVAL